MKAAIAAICALGLLSSTSAAACGREDDACDVPLGDYRVALPDGEGPHPGVLLLHGAGGTGAGMLGLRGTVEALTERGYIVLAPDALPFRPGRRGGVWAFRSDLFNGAGRDEPAFLREVVADAATRFDLDPDAVILSGFSAGGFMVTYIACATPDAFAAYAPVSGGFWRPHPETCEGPVNLLHTHGWRDGTVPLEGRPLRNGQWEQGDIFEGLGLFRTANACTRPDPSGYRSTDDFQRRYWDCADDSALELALFPGGHGIPKGWAGMMLDWYEALATD